MLCFYDIASAKILLMKWEALTVGTKAESGAAMTGSDVPVL